VRRTWRCPKCGRVLRTAGQVVAVPCSCVPERTWMTLEPPSPRLRYVPPPRELEPVEDYILEPDPPRPAKTAIVDPPPPEVTDALADGVLEFDRPVDSTGFASDGSVEDASHDTASPLDRAENDRRPRRIKPQRPERTVPPARSESRPQQSGGGRPPRDTVRGDRSSVKSQGVRPAEPADEKPNKGRGKAGRNRPARDQAPRTPRVADVPPVSDTSPSHEPTSVSGSELLDSSLPAQSTGTGGPASTIDAAPSATPKEGRSRRRRRGSRKDKTGEVTSVDGSNADTNSESVADQPRDESQESFGDGVDSD
ncbi:MAG: hypothetical protein NT069_20085, partial [Planctomycetota bacterium]|nr:hypothetical protein [Planctomycetota bacterium]